LLWDCHLPTAWPDPAEAVETDYSRIGAAVWRRTGGAVDEMTARCPRCNGIITATPNEERVLICPQCGARLRAPATVAPATSVPTVTALGVPAAPAALSPAPSRALAAVSDSAALLVELRALVRGQEESLRILREVFAMVSSRFAFVGSPQPPGNPDPSNVPAERGPEAPATLLPVRTRRRRKMVLLVDDDDGARREAEAAFEAAHVPVRTVADGRAALAAINTERPDVIVLELGLPDPVSGRDVINMIKATMEWVGIPIVLYTGLPIESQKEARIIHGADDLVRKGPGEVEALVARVIQIFQREG
jgi:CheY-like chemotaxis protein